MGSRRHGPQCSDSGGLPPRLPRRRQWNRTPRMGHPRIVVGVDGSPASVDALRWAARQSDLTGAAVEAVISLGLPQHNGDRIRGQLDIDWADNARATLADAVHVALGSSANPVTMTVTRGHPAEVLVAAARGADLLVVRSAATWRFLAGCSARSANTSPPVHRARSSWSGTSPDPIALGQRTHLSASGSPGGDGIPMNLSPHEQQILDEIEQAAVRAKEPRVLRQT